VIGRLSFSLNGHAWALPGWLPGVLLLIGTAVLGPQLGALSRPLFILGCVIVGWDAWRRGPAVHLSTVLILFAFSPLVRRIVDLSVGYDTTGLMLVGPLLAILAPIEKLPSLLSRGGSYGRQIPPILIVAGCVTYAAMITLLQGDWMNTATGILKWFAALIYAAVLSESADRDEVLRAASSAFLVILPVTGLIGIEQYIDPPSWDRYWMQFAPIMSVGQPIPYGVRVFSTVNGPASFATFTAAGILLVWFLRSEWYARLLVVPAALALLLSLYRTAWMSLGVGILFCLAFQSTRRQARLFLGSVIAIVAAAGTLGPFAEVIGERMMTLVQGSQDGSAQERLEQYVAMWNQSESAPFGIGFTTVDVGSAGTMAIDGLIIYCWISMGIAVGLICLFGLVWAAANAIKAALRDDRKEAVVIGALGCGALIQLPLGNIASGELGFLFWTFAALASANTHRTAAGGAT